MRIITAESILSDFTVALLRKEFLGKIFGLVVLSAGSLVQEWLGYKAIRSKNNLLTSCQ